MNIFISYRRKDSGREVGRVRDRLKAAFGEQSVFRDLVDIPGGVDFRTVLERETNDCKVMLVFIGPLWVSITDDAGNKRLFNFEDPTRLEVERGLEGLREGKTAVFPILVLNAVMPSPTDLPESLRPLCYQNANSIRDDPDFDGDMEKLIQDIRRSQGYLLNDLQVDYFEPETVHIAEGPFWMGNPEADQGPEHEKPYHQVRLPAYRIGRYPVTNAQYEEFTRQTRRLVPAVMGWDGQKTPVGLEGHPVTGVTWYEALAYCQWLSEKTGRKYSLPNEAQWEKACRGGAESIYPWGNTPGPKRSNQGCTSLAAVDAYPPQNEFGCFDLVGNVRQWTSTLWGPKHLAPDPRYIYPWKNDSRNDLSANRQIRRVIRGSSFAEDIQALRCSAHSSQFPDDAGVIGMRHGFRVVMNY